MQPVTTPDDLPPEEQPGNITALEPPPEKPKEQPKAPRQPPMIKRAHDSQKSQTPVLDRLPPHSPQAESAIISCCLLEGDVAITECTKRGIMSPVFYDLKHQILWRIITGLWKKDRKKVDYVTVCEEVVHHNKTTRDAIDLAYVSTICDEKFISASNISYYADIVLEKWILRESVHMFTDAVARIYEDESDIHELLSDSARVIQHVTDAAARLAGQNNVGVDLTMRSPSNLAELHYPDDDCILGDRLLAVGQSLVVAGAGGIGKSRLAGMQLPIACITGQPFIGIETHNPNLRWLLLQVENSNRRLTKDLVGFRNWCNGTWDRVDRQLLIHTIENDGDTFVALDNAENFMRVSRAIEDSKADVVIFDSLYNFTTEDLNTDVGMSVALSHISRVYKRGNPKRAAVILHHAGTGKFGASRAMGYDRSSFGRNSKVLYNWCRAQINVAPGKGDVNDSLVVSCGKNNNGKEFPKFAIKLNEQMVYATDPNFDMKAWESEVTGRPRRVTMDEVVALVPEEPMKRAMLVTRIIENFGIQKSAANDWVRRAIDCERLDDLAVSKMVAHKKKAKGPNENKNETPPRESQPELH